MRSSVVEWLEQSAERYPGRKAFFDTESAVTYAEALRCARSAGTALAGTVPPGKPVAILMGRHALTPVFFFSVLYAGCYYVPLCADDPPERLRQILGLVRPAVLLADREHQALAGSVSPGCTVLLAEDIREAVADDALLAGIRRQACDQMPMYVIFTSGSTGVPKGAVTSHRAMETFISGLIEAVGIDDTDVIGSQAPMDYVGAVKDLYSGVRAGAPVFIIPKKYFVVTDGLFDLLGRHGVTSIAWTVSALTLPVMQDTLGNPPAGIRRVCFTGAVMPGRYLRAYRMFLPDAAFYNLYGPTEVTACSSCCRVEGDISDGGFTNIGRPFRNYTMFVLRDDGTLARDMETGELYVGGAAISLGYYDDPARTAEWFTQNPLHSMYRDIVYRTGDLAARRPDGTFEYHGRKDRQIKLHGYRIELGEVEETARTVDGVNDCCALHHAGREQIWLYYAGPAADREIALALRRKLPAYMVPRKFIRLEQLPVLPNFKTDMRKLAAMMEEASGGGKV